MRNISKTHPIGEGTKNVTGNISEDLYDALLALAERSDVGISTYAKCLYLHAADNQLVFDNAHEMKGRASHYRKKASRRR